MTTKARARGAYHRGPRIESSGPGGRYYVWKRQMYWSVTTIINNGIPKPYLTGWAKKVTAEAAARDLDLLPQIHEREGDGGVIAWLKGAADRARDRAGVMGNDVHKAAEAWVLEKPAPDWTEEQAPYMKGLLKWFEDYKPTFVAAEVPVFSDSERYAGTLDGILELDRDDARLMWQVEEKRPVRLIVDYKTSAKGPYPETGLQLAAYRFADTWLGLPDGSEAPMPEIDGGAVLHVRPRKTVLIPYRCDRAVFQFFLYAREMFRFNEEVSDGIMYAPFGPEGEKN